MLLGAARPPYFCSSRQQALGEDSLLALLSMLAEAEAIPRGPSPRQRRRRLSAEHLWHFHLCDDFFCAYLWGLLFRFTRKTHKLFLLPSSLVFQLWLFFCRFSFFQLHFLQLCKLLKLEKLTAHFAVARFQGAFCGLSSLLGGFFRAATLASPSALPEPSASMLFCFLFFSSSLSSVTRLPPSQSSSSHSALAVSPA